MKQLLREHRWAFVTSVAVTAVGLLLYVAIHFLQLPRRGSAVLRLVDNIENRTLDMRFQLRGARRVDSRIIIVAIDQNTINRLGWPFSRSHYARVINNLHKDGARVIGFDVAFPFPDPNSPAAVVERLQAEAARAGAASDAAQIARLRELAQQLDSDKQLAEAMQAAGNVVIGHTLLLSEAEQASLDPQRIKEYQEVLSFQAYSQVRKVPAGSRFPYRLEDPSRAGASFDVRGIQPNLRIFADAAKSAGFFDFVADNDGVFRRAPLVIRQLLQTYGKGEENFFPSLAAQVLIEYLRAGPNDVVFYFNENGPERLEIGQYVIRPDIAGQVLVNFADPQEPYQHLSFGAVAEGITAPGTFKDKIVLVGATATGIGDIRNLPYGAMPGVEIHANVIDNILNNNFLKRGGVEELLDILVLLVCGLGAGLFFALMRPSLSWIVFVGAAAALFAFNYLQFRSGRWLDLVLPAGILTANYVAVTSYRVIFEEREKRRMRGAFSMYVHPDVVGQIMKNPGLLRLGGEETELSVLFSDVRGFTTISEQLTPTELVLLLNEYLTAMSDIIMANLGTVDKYEGDAIMAFWGRPNPIPDHAAHACRSALVMLHRLDELNRRWREGGKPPLDIGIGINTGPMVIGNMGSNKRFNYTVMGDAVNLGSRLEGQTKEYGAHIIISESTYAQVQSEFVCRELDLIRVKGKLQPVAIYEVLAFASESEKWQPLVTAFARGLQAYRNARFTDALREFETILDGNPEDGPSKVFARRCRTYLDAPPKQWDGVYVAVAK